MPGACAAQRFALMLNNGSLVVTNDEATYLIRKPRELPAGEISKLIELGQRGEFTELYRRCRVKIKDGRTTTPSETVCNPSPLAIVRATSPAMMLPPPALA